MQRLIKLWYQSPPLFWLLRPFSWGYQLICILRRTYYQHVCVLYKPPVPVIVVGNISVGGTGKTPCLLALIELLQQEDLTVGVISRGYKAKATSYPISVTKKSSANNVGDEPFMIAKKTGVPVIVDPNRVRALKYLLHNNDCDIVLSDDGLQHYRLYRDIEIAVVDATRDISNHSCLPAGPYREPPSRLKDVDFIIHHGDESDISMQLKPVAFENVQNPSEKLPLNAFTKQKVHALTGIGHPARFFNTLKALGCSISEHAFFDHHPFCAADLHFSEQRPIIMTEKDAVKCHAFADSHCWYLAVKPILSKTFIEAFRQKIATIRKNNKIKQENIAYG